MCGFIYYYFHSALEHKYFLSPGHKMKKTCISRAGTVLFILPAEFKTFSVSKWHKKLRCLGIIWVTRRLWGPSLLLCLGLGQQLWRGTSRGLFRPHTLSMKCTFLVQKREEPGMLLYPILRTPHTCCGAESVPCCNLWDVPLSLACPSRVCRSSCSSTPLVQRCLGSCMECKTHKLTFSVLSCHSLP